MEFIGSCFDLNVLTYKYKTKTSNITWSILSISSANPEKLKVIINYFNKDSLLGVKYIDFKD
jgi:hypothetical protein